ncbi:MAG: ribonuclease D [Chromatiales bacterium]|nr:ribonuclease D [Chromatiales bacterium]
MNETALYIDTPEALQQLCEQLRRHDWFTLDTEFLREKTYRARLCLLQVANPDVIACIDPLALPDLGPLLDLLYDEGITKVLHAAHQDLEIFFDMRGTVPGPIFDTQIAATLLGQGEQIGYGNLVKEVLGVELTKAHARADWCQRPLDADQLAYAADDVRYLRDVYHHQRTKLQELGREAWLAADFAEMTSAERYRNPPEEAWQRLKGANRLRGVQLAVLQTVAAWREEQAQLSDRPRRWILKDEVLLDLARHMPKDSRGMQRIRGLEEGTVKRSGQAILEAINAGQVMPKAQWPTIKQGPRLPAEQDALVDVLMALLRERCREQAISPAAVAGRRDLEKLIMGERDTPLLHGWRGEVAGESLLALLEGRLRLAVRDGRLQVETC